MARLRNVPSSQTAVPAPKGRQALKEKTNTFCVSIPVYEDDGNTEGLVKEGRPKRGRPRKSQQNSDELFMAGGLGTAETSNAHPTSEAPATTDELVKDSATAKSTAKPNRRPARMAKKIVQSEEQAKLLEGLKQRMEATAKERKTKQTQASRSANAKTNPPPTIAATKSSTHPSQGAPAERSEFSLSPSPPPPPVEKLSVAKARRPSNAQPGSALRKQGTPAVETSILALKNFKRRPRQPSMLQMVKQRTASTRPSIAHGSAMDNAPVDQSVFDFDGSSNEEEGEEDFAPEAEGTPLHARASKRPSSSSVHRRESANSTQEHGRSNASRKRKLSDNDVSSGSLKRLRTEKRESHVATTLNDKLPTTVLPAIKTRMSSDRAETPQPANTSDIQVANSPSSSTPPTEAPSSTQQDLTKDDNLLVPSTERSQIISSTEPGDDLQRENEALDGTLAEPATSSPSHEVPSATQADPLTQLSPSPVKERAKRKPKSKPMNTATLQSLLPKRRQPLRSRPRPSEYDLESDLDEDGPLDTSHLEADEDELGNARRPKSKSAPTKAPKATNAKRGRPHKAITSTARKSTAPPPSNKVPQTYGRKGNQASDKENEGYESVGEDEEESTLPDVSVSMKETTKSKELEEARRKFAEVDEWDMVFESMSVDEDRSSSQNWR